MFSAARPVWLVRPVPLPLNITTRCIYRKEISCYTVHCENALCCIQWLSVSIIHNSALNCKACVMKPLRSHCNFASSLSSFRGRTCFLGAKSHMCKHRDPLAKVVCLQTSANLLVRVVKNWLHHESQPWLWSSSAQLWEIRRFTHLLWSPSGGCWRGDALSECPEKVGGRVAGWSLWRFMVPSLGLNCLLLCG